jgi:tagatose kinase
LKKVVTAGEIVVELMATKVGQDFLQPGLWAGPFPSGAPAIFISQVARLGQPCGMIASVGADDFGKLNLERLRDDGVDVSAIAIHPGFATGSAFVRYAADSSRAFVFNIPHSASGLIEIDASAEALLAGADHFHVMGSSLFSGRVIDVVKTGVAAVKARGGTISFDPNIRVEMLEAPGMRAALSLVLDQTDLFLPSGPELYLFAKAVEERAAVAEILARGVGAIVVKKGAGGAAYFDRAHHCSSAAFDVEELDPTGAGDCFGAAFVTEWLRGAAPEAALRFANAAGARAVTKKGPMEGASSRAEIESWMRSAKVLSEAAR